MMHVVPTTNLSKLMYLHCLGTSVLSSDLVATDCSVREYAHVRVDDVKNKINKFQTIVIICMLCTIHILLAAI